MATVDRGGQVLSKAITGVGFRFYNDDEVEAISVKNITAPVLFDTMNRPVPGGLYDAALGPLEQYESCVTCGEASRQCPGHFGHIKLALPVYNPLVFAHLVKILKQVCLFCHHFKMKEKKVQAFADMLELLYKGEETDAFKISLNVDDENFTEIDIPKSIETKNKDKSTPLTAGLRTAIKAVMKKFTDEMPKTKCENCNGYVPTIKSEGVGKIFQLPLQKNRASANLVNGLRLDLASLIEQCEDSKKIMENANGKSITDEGANEESEDGCKSSEVSAIDMFSKQKLLTTIEVLTHIRLLWQKEKRICSLIWGVQDDYCAPQDKMVQYSNGSSDFFLRTILVMPNRFRPPNRLGSEIMDHPTNAHYVSLLQANMNLADAMCGKRMNDVINAVSTSQVTLLWSNLQNCTNQLMDSASAVGKKSDQNGIRQFLEKKEGLFRMNLMGKRVNYSCRSVISPDPYIAVNEIGIPPYFATRLSYPERVTHWNVDRLRKSVLNGASVYPGATHVEDESGVLVSLSNMNKSQRLALSKTLLSTPSSSTGSTTDSVKAIGKIVYRHLRDGDALLVNRQPTLHKPSLMAHIARVLKGEKTLRMHYANCSTYNADFDGDEMNVHFPQDECGRAEAYQIVNANQQFVVPTSGSPIRGLIQDHIVSATLLTKKDTFLTRDEYQELVYSACISAAAPTLLNNKTNAKVGVVEADKRIKSLAPAILKPKRLWTGKQVITTVLNYVTSGRPPYSVKNVGKVSGEYWGRNNGEVKFRIENNELLHGVIDKAQFGKYGLVHAFKEFYGADDAGRLLSVFSRLFTSYLQIYGFTCGVSDLLIVQEGEKDRQNKLASAQELGLKVHKRFVGLDPEQDTSEEQLKLEIEKMLQTQGASASALLDRMMSSSMNVVTSDVNNALFPNGLAKPFPHNCLSLMTTTGAKGGLVNFTQISSLLGQQELEGKRVPRMVSGKTLPCFPPWDTAARAGGFISDRFLTGLKPQEYYFHCMAGRDGLVDTAVKTSRSGYLQRCIIKNLESLRVHYDYSVRDSDGSIIQFRYGEDGVDVMKTSYLTQFKDLAANHKLLCQRIGVHPLGSEASFHSLAQGDESFEKVSEAFEKKMENFLSGLSKKKKKLYQLHKKQNRHDFQELMKLNFISSCAEPGEAVGVLAAQSVGEPSTQMTLNTFHFAGRGEMNVTLGIPRLREIFMTAAKKISTPVMTCPLLHGRSREDAEHLAAKLRRIRLIDVVEKIEVAVVPFCVSDKRMSKVYTIKLHFYPKDRYASFLQLEKEEFDRALEHQFIPSVNKELSKAITSRSGERAKDCVQILSLSKIGEAQEVEEQNDIDDIEGSGTNKRKKNVPYGEQEDDDDDDDKEDLDEDEGADAEKRRNQANDEIAYDDEAEEGEEDSDNESQSDDDIAENNDGTLSDDDGKPHDEDRKITGECRKSLDEDQGKDNSKKTAKNSKQQVRKSSKDAINKMKMEFNDTSFQMKISVKHNTPHVLLTEIVERVAKQVTLRAVNGIDKVSVIDYNGDANIPALQTDGLNFEGLWNLSDDLDVNKLTTNSIAAILEVYGVEAARATIVTEVKNVFGSYGISVDVRHLSLIADYMTHAGSFRPLNRIGIDSCTSPFLKMTFETASKFLVESTLQKQWDHLESPASRIVLGQIAGVGTGSFELLQNIQV